MCMCGGKEGNVLFNDALNSFYLRLYGVRYMVKHHSAREETCCHHMGYSFWSGSKGYFICTIPQTECHIPHPLVHQPWSIGVNENQLNGSTMTDWSNGPWANTLPQVCGAMLLCSPQIPLINNYHSTLTMTFNLVRATLHLCWTINVMC